MAPGGLYPALSGPGILVLPAPPADAVLRAVQSSTTDPVSFALLEGAELARFPRLAGFSAEDSARRAVAEHAAWLGRHPHGGRKELDELAMLLSAARAALFLETLAEGAPELPLTLAATARMLDEPLAEEAFEHYALCLREGAQPDSRIATALETAVRELPVYRPLLDRAEVAA
jgi:hypothetical protein